VSETLAGHTGQGLILDIQDALSKHFSADRAQEHIRALGAFYRSPGSAGYDAAIDYVLAELEACAVDTEVDA
jgi:hypothetical protein